MRKKKYLRKVDFKKVLAWNWVGPSAYELKSMYNIFHCTASAGVPSVFVNIEKLEVKSGGQISLSLGGGGQGGGDGGGQEVRVGHRQGTGVGGGGHEQGRPNDKFMEDFGNKTQKVHFSEILASLPGVLDQVLADRCSRRPGGCGREPGLGEQSKQMDIDIPEGTYQLDIDSHDVIDTTRAINKDDTLKENNITHPADLTDNLVTESFITGQKDNREPNKTGDLAQNIDKNMDSLWNVVLLGHQEHGTTNVSNSNGVLTGAQKENQTEDWVNKFENKLDNLWNVVLLGHQEEDTRKLNDFTKGFTEKHEDKSEANTTKVQVLLGHKTNDNRIVIKNLSN